MDESARNQATAENGYIRVLTLEEFDVRQFTVVAGETGISFDLATRTILAQKDDAPPDDEGWLETMFQIIGVCPHCEAIHRPVFIWRADGGLFVVDADGLQLDLPLMRVDRDVDV